MYKYWQLFSPLATNWEKSLLNGTWWPYGVSTYRQYIPVAQQSIVRKHRIIMHKMWDMTKDAQIRVFFTTAQTGTIV